MRNLKIMLEIMEFGAKLCGSFYVLDVEAEASDSDFYILESQVPAFEAKFLPDFQKDNFTNYADEFTVGLYSYESPALISKDEYGLVNLDDKSNRIEVTVKKDDCEEALLLMWSMLYTNPEIFKAKFWKRNGIPRAVIKERIGHLIKALK